MKTAFLLLACFSLLHAGCGEEPRKIFDVHLHGSKDPANQVAALQKAGVYKIAISSSWELQHNYKPGDNMEVLHGLMVPCPNGKVPYSLQPCFAGGEEWPDLAWVHQQIREGNIDYLGEVLSQYHGISSSDSLLYPYYSLAAKYSLPVGIHTGGAGPDHGSPSFKLEMGNPLLLKTALDNFPGLKVWIMHGGDQFYEQAISIMKLYNQVHMDISVLSNPDIVPPAKFHSIMKNFIDAGLEDRMMFGSDNGNIEKAIAAVESLDFLNGDQKKKIFFQNAERFFRR